MMNPRENYLAFLNHEPTDFTPNTMLDGIFCGAQHETFENGPIEGGYDDWGCNWIPTESAGGQPALDPRVVVLDDVCDWEDVVKFPDLDAFDWQGMADLQLANQDRAQKIVEYHSWNSIFLRMSHLMGFENCLCSMVEEPEASLALMDAIVDHKIRVLDRAIEYFKPDTFVHYDDICTERSPFMSPETYREIIKPCHKKLHDACYERGVIPQIHICGKVESLIEDIIDTGAAAWQAAQPMNDIAGIIERYGDKIGVNGGYDTQGRPGSFNVTAIEINDEIDRCFEEYARFGRGYALFGFFLGAMDNPVTMRNTGIMIERILMHRKEEMGV